MPARRTEEPRLRRDDEADDDLLGIIPERLTAPVEEPLPTDDGGRSRSILLGGLLVGVAVAGGVGFYILSGDRGAGGVVSPQVVTADPAPYKVRPAEPGGMQVPNQDKLVFERTAGADAGEVENLLPEPETPVAPRIDAADIPPAQVIPPRPVASDSILAPPPAPPLAPQLAAPPSVATTAEAAAEPPPSVLAPAVAPAPAPAPVPLQEAAVLTPVPAAPVAAPVAPSAPATPAASGPYMVQFAALRDEASARKLWADLQAKHPALLGGLTLVVQQTDQGERGVFYRVRARGLATDTAGRALCEELAKHSVGCMFVGR